VCVRERECVCGWEMRMSVCVCLCVRERNAEKLQIQCQPLNTITLGQQKSDNNNRMIQLTDVFCVLFTYNVASII
jgi:hypothetical protein